MVFPGARLFRAPIWCPSEGGGTREAGSTVAGSARLFRALTWCPSEGGGTREAGSTVAGSLLVVALAIGCVCTRFGEGGGQIDCRRARRVLNPCAQESKARTVRFLMEKLMSDHGLFSSYEGLRSSERARFVGLFQGWTGPWTAGCWLERRFHQLKASTTMDLGISIFLISVRWPWVGDNNLSRSRLLSIWSMEV